MSIAPVLHIRNTGAFLLTRVLYIRYPIITMALSIQHREGESGTALLYRFTKKIQHSGILKEARGRRFRKRAVNKKKRRISALHRETKKREIELKKKLGLL